MNFLETHESIHRISVEDVLCVKMSRAKEKLTSIMEKQIAIQTGSAPSTIYSKRK